VHLTLLSGARKRLMHAALWWPSGRDLATKTLLPRLDERLARLYATVTAARRGIRNRLNRLWKAGGGDGGAPEGGYPWHSTEAQARLLCLPASFLELCCAHHSHAQQHLLW
jgi:hypothetical protein